MQRRMGGQRWGRAAIAGLLVGGSALIASGGTASAGISQVPSGEVDVRITVNGGPAQDVLDGLTFELFQGGSLVADPGCGEWVAGLSGSELYAETSSTCVPGAGDYQVGIDGAPEQYTVNAFCTGGEIFPSEVIPGESSMFTLGPDRAGVSCTISLNASTLAIDKVIEGEGDATVADFEFEVYDSEGALVDVGELVDPAAAVCGGTLGDCELVGLAAGGYTLGEVLPDYGYAVTGVECTSNIFLGQQNVELIELQGADFTIDVEGDAHCVVTNTYQEGQLVVTAEVVNDDGGTADPTDISIEVYRAGGGTPVVAATQCEASGACLDTMLPIGDYVIGYIGPDGYTREITQTVSDLTVSEMVTDDPDAEFTAEFGRVVEIDVVIDDPEPPPTTTTTTTTTLPAVTTTSIDAGVVTLPETGASSSTNAAIAAMAALLVLLGGAMVAVRRRSS